MSKKNILKLDLTPTSATVIGISSHENDYRLSWSLNEHLGFSFAQDQDMITDSDNEFSCFIHHDENQILKLISNRCDNGFLLNKYKNFDFILKIEPKLSSTELDACIDKLKKIPLISAVMHIPLDKETSQKLN